MPRSAEARFIPPKPYDCFALYGGLYHAMELKLMTKIQSFAFDRVTDWQLKNLLEVHFAEGFGSVVINYRVSSIPERHQKKFSLGKRINTVFCFGINSFIAMDEAITNKSATYGQLVEYCDEQLFKQDGFWDIPKLVGDVDYGIPKLATEPDSGVVTTT
jgi:penicillin-binding protein-related factor A (putative recombinase)